MGPPPNLGPLPYTPALHIVCAMQLLVGRARISKADLLFQHIDFQSFQAGNFCPDL